LLKGAKALQCKAARTGAPQETAQGRRLAMKQQVARFPPHQNAKVMAIMMALTSLIFMIPFLVIGSLFGASRGGMHMWVIIILPVFYLVIGYISVVIGCAIYNVLVPFTGGIEFESTASDRP
jgi:Zn-dependent protease with chaperone function